MLVLTMGISLALCCLSPKREAILREDPALVWELSREVPGYLVVGKAWDALRVAVQPFDCHRRRARVPFPAASPVPRDPPADAETVLRLFLPRAEARVVEALAGRGAAECSSSPVRAA